MKSKPEVYTLTCTPLCDAIDGHYICEYCNDESSATLHLCTAAGKLETFTCDRHKCVGALLLLELTMQPDDQQLAATSVNEERARMEFAILKTLLPLIRSEQN